MDLEGSYQLDKKTGQIIIELTLGPGATLNFDDVAGSAAKGIVNCQVNFLRGADEKDSRLKVTLGLLPVDEPEFNEGPSKEDLTAEFAALPDKSL